MKRKLKSIAMQLSDAEIQELIQFRKIGDKRVVALRRRRDKLADNLAKVERELARLTGGADAAEAPRRVRRPGKRGRPAKAQDGAKPEKKVKKAAKAKKAPGRGGKKSPRLNLSAAVREIFAKAGAPLKASQVVDALPEAGIKVSNVADMRKRISVVLASQKNHFEQVERGVYQLKG